MADQKLANASAQQMGIQIEATKKSTLPARCAERVKQAQIAPDSAVAIAIVASSGSKTLYLGDGKRPDNEIKAMAIHPHGLFVESKINGVTFRVIIPSAALTYELLADGE